MKKSMLVIVAVVIAILVLGGFVFLTQKIRRVADDTRLEAKQAAMKSFVASVAIDILTYYDDVKNTTPYSQNSSTKQVVETRISTLKEKSPGDYSYRIYEGEDFSVKLADKASGLYVCTDTRTARVVDISSSEFEKKTDCAGKAI